MNGAAALRLEQPAIERPASRGLPVRVRNVAKAYRVGSNWLPAVQEIDIDIAPGEFVSIVGPSGCGKSTLLKIVAGLIPPTGGEVEVDGRRVAGPTTEAGVVFQRDLLLEWRTALENVLLQAEIRKQPVRQYEQRARELLASVALAGFEDVMPHQLSGGMRQRVAICRALLHDPPLLLMDEPFGAVDAITRDQLNLDLRNLCNRLGSTVLFITHSITEAVFLSDRVVVMTPRPAMVADIAEINLPAERPLSIREEPEFGVYVREIRETFEKLGVLGGTEPAAVRAMRPQQTDTRGGEGATGWRRFGRKRS
ncbi:MAG TPA: ABC transporter ATP-binding protein [Thermoleophilaceae bacterium]|nr:ABC transporter ATP-binding protein [Thermoleophilaceae bacterium]